jgi:hypothetical protein
MLLCTTINYRTDNSQPGKTTSTTKNLENATLHNNKLHDRQQPAREHNKHNTKLGKNK